MSKVRIRFKGKLLTLITRKARLPNGCRVELEIIRHPGASLIVPFLGQDRIVLLRQLRPVIGSYIYELPAGTLGKNETPLSCARREITEETGYRAARFTRLGRIYPVPGYSTERITVYKAQGLIKRTRNTQRDEIIESIVVTRKEVRRLFRSGKIVDAKTICALAFCGWL